MGGAGVKLLGITSKTPGAAPATTARHSRDIREKERHLGAPAHRQRPQRLSQCARMAHQPLVVRGNP
eukprot:4045680-Pyramimonas_sp.AAC.1